MSGIGNIIRHAFGAVRFGDGKILFCGWKEGTYSENCCLYETEQEVVDRWFSPVRGKCNCGNDETAEIMALADHVGYWEGRACRNCMVVTESNPLIGNESKEPDWSPWLEMSGNLRPFKDSQKI